MSREVYISSTYKDLTAYRDAIIEMFASAALRDNYRTLGMENYIARTGMTSIDVCLEDVRKADIYILILSKNYGSIVPGTTTSYTQTEYEEAKKVQSAGKKPYAVFVFYSNDEFEEHDFRDQQELKNEQLKDFYTMAKKENAGFIYPFKSPETLCNQILLTLIYHFKRPKSIDDYGNYLLLLDRTHQAAEVSRHRNTGGRGFYFAAGYPNNPYDFIARLHQNEIGLGFVQCNISLGQFYSTEQDKFEQEFKDELDQFGLIGQQGNYLLSQDQKTFVNILVSDDEVDQNPFKLDFMKPILRAFLSAGVNAVKNKEEQKFFFCLYYSYTKPDNELYDKFKEFADAVAADSDNYSPGLKSLNELRDLDRTDIINWLGIYMPDFPVGQEKIDKLLDCKDNPYKKHNMTSVKEYINTWIETNLINYDTNKG
ncbi:MAG: DUF4062 domain-containing protein [Bacteroidota bacterium]|nr:DUF4062 domain-containing protein [Bacteroidota bacterium]